MNKREISFYDKAREIDDLLGMQFTDSVERKLFNIILNDSAATDYFLRNVTSTHWFYPLKVRDFFGPHKAPFPKLADQGGYFVPEWDILTYLERVSQTVNISSNERYIDELLTIIKEVSNYRDTDGRPIDNYRTWYYFTKILVNLPTAKISEEIINLISVWLDSRFSTSLPGAEIVGKLLPKFLNSSNPEDWKRAERIIEIVTDIKWVEVPEKQRDVYGRENEPRTRVEPYWLKEGITNHFERIGEVCSINIIDGMAKKILAIFCRQYQHSYDVNYEDKDYHITHSLFEDGLHKISVSFLKYPENWDGYSREKIEKTSILSFTLPEFENRAQFIEKGKELLTEKYFRGLKDEFNKPLSSIYSLYDYSYVWYSSLTDTIRHMSFDNAERVLTLILKEILSSKARTNRYETSKILDKFLSRNYPYPLFKRLVLSIVSKDWNEYKEYFFKTIDLEEIRVFEGSDYQTELSVLLKDNFNKFNGDEKRIIKIIIEKGPESVSPKDPEGYKAYWKQKWLSLLKDDPEFAPLFEEQRKITDLDKDKFTFGVEFKVSKGFGPPPVSSEEIVKMANTELALMMSGFKSERKWEGKSVAGFSTALKDAVTVEPNKFVENLEPFEEIGFIYVYKIIDGLRDAWKGKKEFNWGKVFQFVAAYINKMQFWKDGFVVEKDEWLGGATHEWVIGIIAELIEEGTRDDAWAFAEEHFERAKDIIFYLLREPEEDKEITDYVTHTLNTPCGKLISALVNLALRIARVNDKKGIKTEPRWSEKYKNKFDEILEKKIIEAYTSLGRFLPNLYYLDKKWVVEKVEQISTEKGSKYWEAFMDGYLSIGTVYDDLYKLMKAHYQYGVSYTFKDKRNREYFIQHICIGYLRDQERLDDPSSLFKKVIDTWQPDQIREVISFFWMQRGSLTESPEENEKMKGKIIEFWRHLYGIYIRKDEKSLTQEDKKSLSEASKLAVFLPEIDTESYDWLMLSAPYFHEDFNSPFIIECLDELKNKGDGKETAEYIAQIYLKMLEKITPDFDKKHIRSIVDFLYNAGAHENANKICNIYGSRGNEFLRDIYEKYNIPRSRKERNEIY